MSEVAELAAAVLAKAQVMFLGERFLETLLGLLAFVLVVELLTRRQWKRYWSRGFLTDVAYYLFFACGLYYLLFSGPIDRLFKAFFHGPGSFLLLNPLGSVPDVPKALLVIVAIDGIEYAMHRFAHRNSLYWRFHCIHHSARTLTPLTKFRVHWVDRTVFGTVKAIPIIMLGGADLAWMPYLPVTFLSVFAHFDVDVHWGPVLGRIFVSPRFHRVHHSTDPEQCNTNFAALFSFWDYLFGTAAKDLTRPKAYGCPDVDVPEGFVRQFFFPFLLLAGGAPGRASGAPAPAEGTAR
ncbi:MAG TPA: sterol desaturase family protein [Vicinamibacteria bacterium]|nr:sterol desaturase family protein [Vicinamibacteria bacterium]